VLTIESLCAAVAKVGRLRRTPLLLILILAACNPVRGCPEASFELVPDSRLPRWFSLPAGYVRDDVIVKITYYVPWARIDDAVMELVDQRNGRILAQVTGERCWHPQIDQIKRNVNGGFDQGSRPHYTIVHAAGFTEVIDHPARDSTLRITDDPVLVQEANDSIGRGECRKE
jgi:hypothetical protein